MPLASRPDTSPPMRSTSESAVRRAASCSCAVSSRTNSSAAWRLVSFCVRRICDSARPTCSSAARTRAPRCPKIGIGSSMVACCWEVASNTVRSPPLGRERPSKTLGLGSAPAVTRSARAASASRSEATMRGLVSTMCSSSSRLTDDGSCAQAGALMRANAMASSSLIQLLGCDVPLGGGHVIDARQDEQRNDERRQHAADDDQRERPLRLAADSRRDGHRQQPEQRQQGRHQHCAQFLDASFDDRKLERRPSVPAAFDRANEQQPKQRHLPEKRDEADTALTESGISPTFSANTPPVSANGTASRMASAARPDWIAP